LSLCGAIADIVTRHAGGREVRTIHLRIGQLRQVVPDTLAYCWSLVTVDTALAGSLLDVDHVPVRLECRSCGRPFELGAEPVFACPARAGTDVQVVGGEEFLITSLDLREA
jgi:hydrogenase nickel incorporation protein HypA/HybF